MSQKSLFYEEPKSINPQGLIIASLIGVALAILLAFVYIILQVSIPLIYFAVLVTFGTGILLSFCTRFIAKITHNRNKKSQFIIALIIGILLNYFQWVAYLLYVSKGQIPAIGEYLLNLGLIFSVNDFWGAIMELNSIGLWSVFGIEFKGGLLSIIWVLEFLLILLVPIIYIRKSKIFPYSEKYGKWYPKFTLEEKFKIIHGAPKIIESLKQDVYKTIDELGLGKGDRFTKIYLYYLEDEQNQYIDFERVIIDREGKEDKDFIIENFRIEKETTKKILQTFSNKKEQLEVI